jgi:WD40 repeat protein
MQEETKRGDSEPFKQKGEKMSAAPSVICASITRLASRLAKPRQEQMAHAQRYFPTDDGKDRGRLPFTVKTKLAFILSLVLILSAGGLLLFTLYSSYTPLRTIFTLSRSNTISSVAWSPDSQEFAAVTDGKYSGTGIATVTLWRTRDAQELWTYTFPSPPSWGSQLAWAPDGRSFALAWADGSIEIWEAKAGKDSSSWSQNVSFRIDAHPGRNGPYPIHLAWSALGKHLLVSYEDDLLFVWNAQERRMLPPILAPHVAGERSFILALSPLGTRAIISGQQAESQSQIYAIWDTATSKKSLLPSLKGGPLCGTGVAWSSDENAVAVRTCGETVMIWRWNEQSTTWTFVHSITAGTYSRPLGNLALSPGGKYLAAVDDTNVIRLWNAENGNLLGPPFPLFAQPISRPEVYFYTDTAITTLAWSPNGKYLLSGGGVQVILREVL